MNSTQALWMWRCNGVSLTSLKKQRQIIVTFSSFPFLIATPSLSLPHFINPLPNPRQMTSTHVLLQPLSPRFPCFTLCRASIPLPCSFTVPCSCIYLELQSSFYSSLFFRFIWLTRWEKKGNWWSNIHSNYWVNLTFNSKSSFWSLKTHTV